MTIVGGVGRQKVHEFRGFYKDISASFWYFVMEYFVVARSCRVRTEGCKSFSFKWSGYPGNTFLLIFISLALFFVEKFSRVFTSIYVKPIYLLNQF